MRFLQPKNVVVPVEPSDVPFELLEHVLAEVGIEGTHVIAVWPPTENAETVNWGTVDNETREKYAIRDLRERLQGRWYADMPVQIAFGEPAAEICRFARQKEADLVVMPTHQRTGFDRVLNGSVAERAVRRCECPVLVVPIAAKHGHGAAEYHPVTSELPAGHRGGW